MINQKNEEFIKRHTLYNTNFKRKDNFIITPNIFKNSNQPKSHSSSKNQKIIINDNKVLHDKWFTLNDHAFELMQMRKYNNNSDFSKPGTSSMTIRNSLRNEKLSKAKKDLTSLKKEQKEIFSRSHNNFFQRLMKTNNIVERRTPNINLNDQHKVPITSFLKDFNSNQFQKLNNQINTDNIKSLIQEEKGETIINNIKKLEKIQIINHEERKTENNNQCLKDQSNISNNFSPLDIEINTKKFNTSKLLNNHLENDIYNSIKISPKISKKTDNEKIKIDDIEITSQNVLYKRNENSEINEKSMKEESFGGSTEKIRPKMNLKSFLSKENIQAPKIENNEESDIKRNESEQKFFSSTTSNFKRDSKPDLNEILKRVYEKNKQEAAAKNRQMFTPDQRNYLNIQRNTNSAKYFIDNSNSRRNFGEIKKNSIEFSLKNQEIWKKHEELWTSIVNPGFMIIGDIEKYLSPPNDFDIMLSIYFKLNSIKTEKVIFDDKIENPKAEIMKWKEAYKKSILRWHPDKSFPLLDSLKIKDETRKNLKKKCGLFVNNINKQLASIVEFLRSIKKY